MLSTEQDILAENQQLRGELAALRARLDQADETICSLREAQSRQTAADELFRATALHALLETSPDPVFAKDREGRMLLANPATLRAIGKSAEQVIGRSEAEWLDDPAQAAIIMANDRSVMESARMHVFEEEMHTPAGPRVFLGTRVPLRDHHGQVVGIIGISRDITERKQMEEALRQSEQRLQHLVQSNVMGAICWDASGQLTEANDAFLAMLGFTREDLLSGRVNWIALTPPEFMDVTLRALQTLQATGTCPPFEKEFFRKDGTRVPVVVVACATYEPAGGDAGICFVLDVSERKRAEEALRESEQKLQRLFRIAPALIAVHEGPEHVYRFSNALHDRLLGHRPLIGLSLREAMPEIVGHGVIERFDRVYATGEPLVTPELPTVIDRRGDGVLEECYFSQVLQPWFDAEGRVAGVMGFAFEVTEQVRAREAVQQSEERLRLALEAGRMGTWSLDVRTGSVGWDATTRRIMGMATDEPLSYWREQPIREQRAFAERIHPEDRSYVDQAIGRAMDPSGDGRYVAEYRVVWPDASVHWVLGTGQVAFAGEGPERTPVRMLGTIVDVTEHREIERALGESEARFRYLVESLPQLVWAWRPDGLCDYLSPQWLAYTGQTEGAHLGTGWREALHPDDFDRVVACWQAAVDNRDTYDLEYRLRRADGAYHWFHSRATAVRDADGRIVRWFGTSTDVHDRKLTEERLREAEERFRTLADNIPQLAWMANETGSIFWYNARWFEYTGMTMEETQGQGWRAVHHPEHVDRVVENYRRCFASGTAWEDTFPLRGKDGRYRWFLSRAIPIRDQDGKVLRWFGTNTDVTAQREVEEALKEADRRKDEFLAMLAHELRNPLAPIRTALEVMNLVGSDGGRARHMRDMIERQVTHMARLIDDLLDVSRIARGKVQLRMERCDLVAIVRNVTDDYRPILTASGLTLAVELPIAPLWLQGDATRLAQVIGNLLSNANKFTPAGGRVSVTVHADGQDAVLAVRDTGMGIEPSILAHVFEPFIQADLGLDRSKGGLGLGLALVRGLIELHGGTAEAESRGVGQGATFRLRLPLEQPSEATASAGAGPAGSAVGAGGGLRILIVEDNRDTADSLQELLTLLGHEAAVAYAGTAGLELAPKFRPDVVLCDIGLPGLDGFEVARALRRDPVTRGAYLIAQTGYGQDEDRRRTREAGFDQHMRKPIELDELQRILATIVPAARRQM